MNSRRALVLVLDASSGSQRGSASSCELDIVHCDSELAVGVEVKFRALGHYSSLVIVCGQFLSVANWQPARPNRLVLVQIIGTPAELSDVQAADSSQSSFHLHSKSRQRQRLISVAP